MRVLVTGAAGWTAKAIIEALVEAKHQVIGFDLPEAPLQADEALFEAFHTGTVADYARVLAVMRDCDAIVHLAVAIGGGYDTPKIPFDVNVRGTANVLAAARHHEIKRIIIMSSAPVHLNIGRKIYAVIDRLQSSEGDFLYDMTKCLQEDIARYYGQTFGLDVLTLRAGHIVDGRADVDPKGRPLADVLYARGGWVCRYDLADAVVHALNYELNGYDAFHIIGAKEAEQHFDIARTEVIFGFVPATQFEAYPAE